MPLSKEDLEKLEAAHKRIAVVRGEGGVYEVVFRKPTRAEYKQFRATKENPDAQEKLARQTVVYPSPEAFDALLEDWPAIPEASSKAFSVLLGLAVESDLK